MTNSDSNKLSRAPVAIEKILATFPPKDPFEDTEIKVSELVTTNHATIDISKY